MDPTEGLPIAIDRSAIVRATRKVIKYRFREFALGFAFKIMQVEQTRTFGLIGAGAFSVNCLMRLDDLSTCNHGSGFDNGKWTDFRTVLNLRRLEQ